MGFAEINLTLAILKIYRPNPDPKNGQKWDFFFKRGPRAQKGEVPSYLLEKAP